MKCERCGRELECAKSGRWHDEDFGFECTEFIVEDYYSGSMTGPHRPKVDTNDALEAWLDAP